MCIFMLLTVWRDSGEETAFPKEVLCGGKKGSGIQIKEQEISAILFACLYSLMFRNFTTERVPVGLVNLVQIFLLPLVIWEI